MKKRRPRNHAPKFEGRAFGAGSRARMLDEYFAGAVEVTPANAWLHVYRLLLWIDRTTALAHCYESDKSQPGRPWYARSLVFHEWVAAQLGSAPNTLADEIDWLFKRGTERLAAAIEQQIVRRTSRAEEQREPYEARQMPSPGDDPLFDSILMEELREWLTREPPPEVRRRLVQRLRVYLSQENKRKNLVGEGFEDVLAAIIRRLPGGDRLTLLTRTRLSSLPGFREPVQRQKEKRVDLMVIDPSGYRRLISAKWSVRADREEQLATDFEAYANLESSGQNFDYVLVTNEFDAARLVAACERRRQNATLFSDVVHVNPEGPRIVHQLDPRGAAERLPEQIDRRRLLSLEQWLTNLQEA